MKPAVRASVAYIAGRILCGMSVTAIYDRTEAVELRMEDLIEGGVKLYDCPSRRLPFASGEGAKYKIFHHEDGHCIDLSVSGKTKTFKGYDFGSSCFFAGKVNCENVTLFDFGEQKQFQFLICDGVESGCGQ